MDVTTAAALLDLRGPFLHAFLHVVRPCWITVSLFLSHITRTHTHKMHHTHSISASTRVDKASLWADGRSDQVDWGGTKFPVQTKTARVRQHPSCLSENAFTYDLCICVYVYCIFYMLVLCVCVVCCIIERIADLRYVHRCIAAHTRCSLNKWFGCYMLCFFKPSHITVITLKYKL